MIKKFLISAMLLSVILLNSCYVPTGAPTTTTSENAPSGTTANSTVTSTIPSDLTTSTSDNTTDTPVIKDYITFERLVAADVELVIPKIEEGDYYVAKDFRPTTKGEWFIDSDLGIDIKPYISSFAMSESASAEFKELFDSSDDIDIVKGYGRYFEHTTIRICLFYKSGELIGSRAVYVVSVSNGVPALKELATYWKEEGSGNYDDDYYKILNDRYKKYPTFNFMGVSYRGEYWSIFGMCDGDDQIRHFLGTLNDYRLVDPFKTVDEAREAYDEYWRINSEIRSRIPVYMWDNMSLSLADGGYIVRYINDFVEENPAEDRKYLDFYDSCVTIPLLTIAGEDNVYILHQLYYHNHLLAEIIVERSDDDYYSSVYKIIAEKNEETGLYTPLTENDYVKQFNKLFKEIDDPSQIKGVGFDGEKYVLIMK